MFAKLGPNLTSCMLIGIQGTNEKKKASKVWISLNRIDGFRIEYGTIIFGAYLTRNL